jgi:NAD(P)-dependent dehydrogenase (short-subunit alcohol dehydrogenase family)
MMDSVTAYVQDPSFLTALAVIAVSLLLAGQFDNHLWRLILIAANYAISTQLLSPSMPWWAFLVEAYLIMHVPHLRRHQERKGCVFITGADSGMGQATVVHLAKTNGKNGSYDCIFAGAYDAKKAELTLKELCSSAGADYSLIKVVPLDVTSDDSVAAAVKLVQKTMDEMDFTFGLTGLVNYHGIAFNGPVAYMPMDMYQRQHDVNYIGNIRMTQQFLPLLKEASSSNARGRIVFTGTGGGPCSPCPPLLSAYMSSKFACEAFAQSLRMELHMMDTPIDCCVINPGFVKPTMLMEEGKKLTDKMWKACAENLGNTAAEDEYGPMMQHFNEYAACVPGTHVTEVCLAAEHALTAYRPRSSYKVGIDSKFAPIVGMLPTGVREKISLHGMYGVLSPAGTVKGYRV